MNVVKVTPNISVIPTTQQSQVQGFRDAPNNCRPQLASQRKWDYETRSQAGKFNTPRPLGSEPKAETRFTLPKAETRFTLPKVETRFTLPKVESLFTLLYTKPFDFNRARASSRQSHDLFMALVDDFLCLVARARGMKKAEKEAEIYAFGEKWTPLFRADSARLRREYMESTSI